MRLFCCNFLKLSVYQSAIFVAILIQVDDHEVIGISISNFSQILLTRYLHQLSILVFLCFFKQLVLTLRHVLSHELIIKIKVILHFLYLIHVFSFQSILKFAFLCNELLKFLLLLIESFLFFFGKIVSMFDLKIKPLSINSISHAKITNNKIKS